LKHLHQKSLKTKIQLVILKQISIMKNIYILLLSVLGFGAVAQDNVGVRTAKPGGFVFMHEYGHYL
jgi:hypothetical protein